MACKCRIKWIDTPYEREEVRDFGEDDDGNTIVATVPVRGFTRHAEIEKCPECRHAGEMRELLDEMADRETEGCDCHDCRVFRLLVTIEREEYAEAEATGRDDDSKVEKD